MGVGWNEVGVGNSVDNTSNDRRHQPHQDAAGNVLRVFDVSEWSWGRRDAGGEQIPMFCAIRASMAAAIAVPR